MPPSGHSGRLEPARHGATLQQNGLKLIGSVFVSQFIEYEQPVQLAGGAFVASRIGGFSYMSLGVRIHHTTIGRYCSIADNVTTAPGDRPTDHISTSPASFSGTFDWFRPAEFPSSDGVEQKVTIGNDVWIGTDVLILGGVKIGDGAIIGARSVVTRDVAPYTIVGGVPARVIRKRFEDSVIERLLILAVWKFDLPFIFKTTKIPIHLPLTPSTLDSLEQAVFEGGVPRMPSLFRRLYPSDEGQWRLDAVQTTGSTSA